MKSADSRSVMSDLLGLVLLPSVGFFAFFFWPPMLFLLALAGLGYAIVSGARWTPLAIYAGWTGAIVGLVLLPPWGHTEAGSLGTSEVLQIYGMLIALVLGPGCGLLAMWNTHRQESEAYAA